MPWVGGPVEIVTVAVFAIAGLVVWLRRGRGYQGPRLMDDRTASITRPSPPPNVRRATPRPTRRSGRRAHQLP